MDAGDPSPGAVWVRVRGGLAGCRKPVTATGSALVCRHVLGLARGLVCGRGVPQFVSQCPMHAS
jgi:hypothetical protein